jgi:DegV family protein with EDD domain
MSDSCSDIPVALEKELDLLIVPLSFTIGGKEYYNFPDEREISLSAFYDILRRERKSSTSAVNTTAFISYMEPVLASGKDLIYLAFSSALSATYNASVMACAELREKYPERRIHVVDTLCASMGLSLLIYLTAQEKKKGKTVDEVRDYAENTKLHICHWFTVDDLHHLHSGGRVSKTSAVLGSMLNIKPVLHVDDEGRLIPVAKVSGTGNALKMLLDKMAETVIDEQTVFISHGNCIDRANELADMVRARFAVTNIIINHIGPVIGSHAGPGTIALFFKGSRR